MRLSSLDAGAGRGRVSAPAELAGDLVDVHLLVLGAKADPGQGGIDLLEETGHDHALDGPDMIDQPFRIIRAGAGARAAAGYQPLVRRSGDDIGGAWDG